MKLDATILLGDVIEQLRTLPDESVHCVVTSPPYWNLRDYKDTDGKSVTGQIGLEPTLGEYIEKMVTVFEEVRRVLRADGTCWVNLGDCYAGGGNGGGGSFAKDSVHAAWAEEKDKNVPGRKGNRGVTKKRLTTENAENTERTARSDGPYLKRKDLAGVPWRVALALQAAGWYLRCDVIWNKPNPMPESVYDRPTRAHEYLFLLTKSDRYFYDHEAVKEPVTGNAHARSAAATEFPAESSRAGEERRRADRPTGWASTNLEKRSLNGRFGKQSAMGRRHAGFNERWKAKNGGTIEAARAERRALPGGELAAPLFPDFPVPVNIMERPAGDGRPHPKNVSRSSRFVTDRIPSKEQRANGGVKANRSFSAAVVGLVSKRTRRSVWTIPTFSYRGEHFATFPPKLVEPCVLAGSSEGGCCSICGSPRRRVVEDGLVDREHQRACGGDRNGEYHGQAQKDYAGAKAQNASETKARILAGMVEKKTVGWQWGCECGERHEVGVKKRRRENRREKLTTEAQRTQRTESEERKAVPCVVMDPFNGTATVGEVALLHGRRYIGIDISAKYVALSNERLGKIQLPLVMY
jgi:DNA modification methylase